MGTRAPVAPCNAGSPKTMARLLATTPTKSYLSPQQSLPGLLHTLIKVLLLQSRRRPTRQPHRVAPGSEAATVWVRCYFRASNEDSASERASSVLWCLPRVLSSTSYHPYMIGLKMVMKHRTPMGLLTLLGRQYRKCHRCSPILVRALCFLPPGPPKTTRRKARSLP